MRARKFIYDTKTTNVSFRQTAIDLKNLGIKNNLFFLKLYDESLQGIDPHSPFLPQETIIKIIQECVINPWYFLRECVYLPAQGGTTMRFELHRANLAMIFLLLNGIDTYTTIPRQKGKTQSAVAGVLWTFLFGTTNSQMLFVNIKEEGAIENLNRLKAQRDLLPEYMQFKVAVDDEGKLIAGTNKHTKSLINYTNKNKIIVAPSASSLARAEQIGRGYSQPVQYYDEFEFINFNSTIVEAAGPAYAKSAINAAKNNGIYGRIFTSTPGNLEDASGKEAAIMIDGMCRFSDTFYDKFATDGKEALKEYIRKNSKNSIVYIEYSYKQLGEGESWFYEMCRSVNFKPEKIKREILIQRISSSSLSPFSPDDLLALEHYVTSPIEERYIMPDYKLDIYEKINKEKCYFVGVDVSNGYGQDNSAVVVFDPYEMQIIAEFKSPFIGVPDLIKFLRILIKMHIPRGILCIERNMNGESVISFLRKSDVRHAIYYDHQKELCDSQIEDKLDNKGLLKLEAARRRLFGVYTQGKSRTAMFLLLDKYMNEKKDLFRGREVISDIKKLIKKNNKIIAGPGHHDDCIMALLIALYVLAYGKQLNRFGYYAGEFIPESITKEVDDKQAIMSALEEIPELKQLYGEVHNLTSDDYDKELMRAMSHREITEEEHTYKTKSGVKVTTRSYTDSDNEDPNAGYTSLPDDFLNFLNS